MPLYQRKINQEVEFFQEIDRLQAQIEAHGKLPAEVWRKIEYKFRLDWNYFSNSMEGNTLTQAETRGVMMGNITVSGKPLKDVLEVKGHDEVVREVLIMAKGEIRLSESRIKAIHKSIMYESDPSQAKQIGVWKTQPNHIINSRGEKSDFTQPEEVADEMHKLINQTNADLEKCEKKSRGYKHPIVIALDFHLRYVAIHPFYDGNGRTARILTNLILISCGYPVFWIKPDERDRYHETIGEVTSYGAKPNLFYEVCCKAIQRSQRLILEAIGGKDLLESDDFDKQIALLKQMQKQPKAVKDRKTMALALEVVLIHFLKKLEPELKKLASLFKSSSWVYWVDTDSAKRGSLHDLLKYFGKDALREGNSDITIRYWLKDYQDKIPFSRSVNIKIAFDREHYTISVSVGGILKHTIAADLITMLLKDKDPEDDWKHLATFEYSVEYDDFQPIINHIKQLALEDIANWVSKTKKPHQP